VGTNTRHPLKITLGFYLQKWFRKVMLDGSVQQNSYICGPLSLMKLDVLFDKRTISGG